MIYNLILLHIFFAKPHALEQQSVLENESLKLNE